MNEITKANAIAASLSGRWQEVVDLCGICLNEEPENIEMLNRLAYAYLALGKTKEAKSTYNKVLKIDKLNPIAHKSIKRLDDHNSRKITENIYTIDYSMFLEEAGKTKIVSLINTAPSRLLKTLRVGQPLQLQIKRLKIFILNTSGEFIGMLSDTLSKRLITFIKGGNKYNAYIRALEDQKVSIFIKEIKQSSRYKNQLSFPLQDGQKNKSILSKERPMNEK